MIKIRRSRDRGYADHGWLRSFHTFSFADYHDPKHVRFGPLRVINEDWVAPGRGFGMHPHDNMEIFTYVISGELTHKDSMGNSRIIRAGEFQAMSAGTGVLHSEMNLSTQHAVHLLQIWIFPDEKDLTPSYSELVPEEKSLDPLVLLASPNRENGSLKIHQNAKIFLGHLEANKPLSFKLSSGAKSWIQIISGSLSIGSDQLIEGDGAGITDESQIDIVAQPACKFLLFEFENS